MKPSPKTFRVWMLLALACISSLAHAGLFDDDEARRAILDLRQRLETTEKKLAEETQRAMDEAAQLRQSLLEIQNQDEALRVDVARLRGENEVISRDLAESQRKYKDFAQAFDERLRKFEPEHVTIDGQDFVAAPDEKRDFEAALAIFRKGDFVPAQAAFADFSKRYPQSGYLPSALFWLGNAQYANRNYKESIQSFRSLLAKAPEHMRAADALLSIANCQVELKELSGARKTLESLIKTYPKTEAAAVAKERLPKLK